MPSPTPDFCSTTGESCPRIPQFHAGKVMQQLHPGQVLEALSDCPQSINNIPIDARNHGYEVLDVAQNGPTIRYLLRR